MSYLVNNQQRINDIIFANRNKNYGAYAIRSAYGNTVVKALSLMLLGFGSFISVAFYLTHRNNGPDMSTLPILIQDSNITVICDVRPPEIEQPAQPTQPVTPAAPVAGALSTNLQDSVPVVTNTVASDPLTMGAGTTISTDPVGPATPTGNITSTITVTPTIISTPPVYIPDSNPEYEGGLAALYAFLSSKLKYPEIAKEIGKEGNVYVKFVVDVNGKVTNVSLNNTQGYGLDEEAVRVVSLIPKFKKPGMLNGKPVGVYFQLPIKFKLK